jgi:hypothetical protein
MTIQLKNLHEWELVDLVVRRHWIAFVFLGMYLLGWIMFSIGFLSFIGWNSYSIFTMSIFWMFYGMFLYISWLNYELDLFVFTSSRIITVEQIGFLNRSVGETTLDKVQEATVETKWILANLFDYGTLTVLTAGSSRNFDMTFAPKPLEKARYVNNLCMKYRDSLFGNAQKSQRSPGTVQAAVQTHKQVEQTIGGI